MQYIFQWLQYNSKRQPEYKSLLWYFINMLWIYRKRQSPKRVCTKLFRVHGQEFTGCIIGTIVAIVHGDILYMRLYRVQF